MSRRPSSSAPRGVAAPYSRRTPGQPKSSRQQFSACGACRFRRVRCDLKDFYSSPANSGVQPSCSNCRERGIKCVDEFAEVKAVKLLRRGRRLTQVEALYGKTSNDVSIASSVSQDPNPTLLATAHTPIPQMQPAFLKSSFFRRFCVQRPVIEPGEFASRYLAHINGTTPLSVEGKMLSMILVIWAASFGIDEFGNEITENDSSDTSGDDHSNQSRRDSMLRTEAMVTELLTLVDLHGLLRRPSWDGVKVLLLLLPLTHGIQSHIERRAIHDTTLSHVHSLCNLENPPAINSGLGHYCDILIRARIFWYAHVYEGITTGLEGGRFLLDDDDIAAFENSLPPRYCASATHSIASSPVSALSSPVSGSPVTPTFPFTSPLEHSHSRAALAYLVTSQYFSLALAVSHVCRSIHSSLTSPRSRRRAESDHAVFKDAIVKIWDSLERCWDDFEMLRRNPSGVGAAGNDLFRGEDVERFVSGWQIFIFQCLNVVREACPHSAENNLHLSAIQRCQKFLPRVIKMLQRHLQVPSNFFAYDAGLIRDGCFFAGFLLARSDKFDAESNITGWDADWEEGVVACLQALGEIRWAYCSTQEREKTLRMEWEARIERDTSRRQIQPSSIPPPLKESPDHSPCLNDNTPLPCTFFSDSEPRTLSLISAAGQVRPPLPPLTISFPSDDSGPDTALTDDGSASWEAFSLSPTSGPGRAVTHGSLSPTSSPDHPNMVLAHGAAKTKGLVFGDDDDMDKFSYAVEETADSRASIDSGVWAGWPALGANYVDAHVLHTCDVLDTAFSPLGSARRPYFS